MSTSSTIFILFGFITSVQASCFVDSRGQERCTGLSNGARAGIGIAIAAGFLVLFFFLSCVRRRRTAQANNAYINNPQTQGPAPYQGGMGTAQQQQYGNNHNGGGYGPQYPQQAYAGQGGYSPYPAPGYPPPENTMNDPTNVEAPPSYPGYPKGQKEQV